MRLEKFKEKNSKKNIIIIFTESCILLLAGVFLYTSYAVFTEEKEFNVINGTYGDPGDIYFAIYVDDQIVIELPSKTDGYVFDADKSSCTNSVTIFWNQNDWHADLDFSHYQVESMSRTKCTVYFKSVSTYTISYNVNGGSGSISSQTKLGGIDLRITEEAPSKENYTFVGWSSTPTGPVEYKSGDTFSIDESTTLYAQYGLNYAYHEGNQFVSDTGEWYYTCTLENPAIQSGETYAFTDSYIEWSDVVTSSRNGYGGGYFETNNYLNLQNAKTINFVYDVSEVMGAIAAVDGLYRYPNITFRIIDASNNIIINEVINFAYFFDSVQTLSLDVSEYDMSMLKIQIHFWTRSIDAQTMTFRLYSVYATY